MHRGPRRCADIDDRLRHLLRVTGLLACQLVKVKVERRLGLRVFADLRFRYQQRTARQEVRSNRSEYRSWIGKPDVTAKLNELKCPTLILHGADDPGDRSGAGSQYA